MPSQTRKITHGDALQQKIQSAVEQVYLVAKACYGPASGIAILEAPYGDPLASRDGVSNLQKIHLEDPVENNAARIIIQASKQNNQHVGDGTTAAAILTYHLYMAARKLIAGGYNRMAVARLLTQTALAVDNELETITKSATPELLEHVASIAAGDEAVGTLINEVVRTIGADGGVVVQDFEGVGIYPELVEGFFFPKGFTNVNLTNDPSNLESKYTNVPILVSDKRLATVSDIAPILEKITERKITDLIIIGDVAEEAQSVLLVNRLKGVISTTVVDAPFVAGGRALFLDDLALVTGATVLTAGASGDDFDVSMLGAAEQVVITPNTTSIVGREGSKEDVDSRIADLTTQLDETVAQGDIEAIKGRLNRLSGKLAIIRVGGATPAEQKEIKLRVQDAICAVQAASKGGVVPGGGMALIRAWDAVSSSPQFKEAYYAPFRDLVDNAGLNPDLYLGQLETKTTWYGVDLSADEPKVENLEKVGVVDPNLVVKETVKNATSVVVTLIKATVDLSLADRSVKHD